jgi:hypothetical protein
VAIGDGTMPLTCGKGAVVEEGIKLVGLKTVFCGGAGASVGPGQADESETAERAGLWKGGQAVAAFSVCKRRSRGGRDVWWGGFAILNSA